MNFPKRAMLTLCASVVTLMAQSPAPVPGCHAKGVTMHTLYGKTDDVLRAASRMPGNLDAFRMHLILVESSTGSEAIVYEKTSAGWQASSWNGGKVIGLREKLDAMVYKTRGSSCAGEEMKTLLSGHGVALSADTTVSGETLQDVMRSVLASGPAGYMRVTVLDPCEASVIEGANLAMVRQ